MKIFTFKIKKKSLRERIQIQIPQVDSIDIFHNEISIILKEENPQSFST